jgi:hypothetical protein
MSTEVCRKRSAIPTEIESSWGTWKLPPCYHPGYLAQQASGIDAYSTPGNRRREAEKIARLIYELRRDADAAIHELQQASRRLWDT